MSSPPKGGSKSTKSKQENSKKAQKSQLVASKRQLVTSSPLTDADGHPGPSTSAPAPPPKTTKATHNNNNRKEPKDDKDKSCCFCWCCCCSCSCLSVHNNMKDKYNSSTDGYDPNEKPSIEEIRSWGESFDRLMRCAAGRKLFREFLRGEYSEENIMFWLACEELKREKQPELVEEKARSIYEDYVSILSPKEVSLDSKVRDVVNRNMVHPTKNTFDEAQLQIYTLMHRDPYPRFVDSVLYRKAAGYTTPPQTRKASISVG